MTWHSNDSAARAFIEYRKGDALREVFGVESKILEAKAEREAAKLASNQVMISYKHKDADFAFKLEERLRAKGFNVWIDKQITPGSDWRAEIGEAIGNSRAVLFIVTEDSVQSKYCKEELYFASGCKIPIFPIKIADAFSSLSGGVKLILQRIQWMDFEEKQFDTAFEALVEQLQSSIDEDDHTEQYSRLAAQASFGLPAKDLGLDASTDEEPGGSAVAPESEEPLPSGHWDVFICCDPAQDVVIGQALHHQLTERKFSVAPLVQEEWVPGGPDHREQAMAAMDRAGCCILIFTAGGIQDRHGYCAELIHYAYEANYALLVLELEEAEISHSMAMMLQMSPRIPASLGPGVGPPWPLNATLDAGAMERLSFEILHCKYQGVKESEYHMILNEAPSVHITTTGTRMTNSPNKLPIPRPHTRGTAPSVFKRTSTSLV